MKALLFLKSPLPNAYHPTSLCEQILLSLIILISINYKVRFKSTKKRQTITHICQQYSPAE